MIELKITGEHSSDVAREIRNLAALLARQDAFLAEPEQATVQDYIDLEKERAEQIPVEEAVDPAPKKRGRKAKEPAPTAEAPDMLLPADYFAGIKSAAQAAEVMAPDALPPDPPKQDILKALATPDVNLEEVVERFRDLLRKTNYDTGKAVLEQFGLARVSELKKEQMYDFYLAVKAAMP